MEILSSAAPERVLYYFMQLCAIPHGSGNTKAVSDYCVRFAEQHGLFCHQDALGNVLIRKDAARGCEGSSAVILQGHLDMVCAKSADCTIDFTKDALRLIEDGGYLRADGTTLGADDGIAVAMALAVLESDQIVHPPLEVLFTVDEEVGMIGAQGFDTSLLRGRRLLNIDSEEEGVLTVSCAGGAVVTAAVSFEEGACAHDLYRLSISGLIGGHSGEEINKGRANAAILLGRAVLQLNEAFDARLVSAESGEKDNAIPCAAEAYLALDDEKAEDAVSLLKALEATLRKEYADLDPEVRISLTPCGVCDRALTVRETKKLCLFLALCPNGVYSMSGAISGLVQSSDNLGIFSLCDGQMTATFLVRSSLESEKALLTQKIRLLTVALGGSVQIGGTYPAWEYRSDSALRTVMVECYRELFGTEPKAAAIHAGLECGIFAGKIPDLDVVSFGPDIPDIHTERERLSLDSVKRTWDYLLAVLKALL